LNDILELAYNHPTDFDQKLRNICQDCGVALVYTQAFSKAPINGAVRWFRNNPLIQLSDRYKSNDKFWFDFFHEAGHILLHGKKDIFLEVDKVSKQNKTKEKEADEFAAKWLMPQNVYEGLAEYYQYDEDIIKESSQEYKIHPGIIVGRLQHEGLLKQNHLNQLKERISLFTN